MDDLHFAMATIWCMSSRHAERPTVVGVLARQKDGEWWPRADNLGEHMTVMEGDQSASQEAAGRFKSPQLRFLTHLGSERPTMRRHFETDPCPTCGDKLSCRAENLDPVLDEFYRRGLEGGIVGAGSASDGGRVLPVPLGALAARLGSR